MICHLITNTKTVIVYQHNVTCTCRVPTTKNNVTVSEVCANGRDIKASYELSYTTDSGTLNTTCVVNGTECSNTCHHELWNNTADSRCYPPVSQFSDEDVTAFLTARNIVGRSNPAVSRNISEFCEVIATYQK